MQTYTSSRNIFGTLSGDSGEANKLVFDVLHGENIRELLSLKPWPFRNDSVVLSTRTDNVHVLPAYCGKVNTITVTIGSTKYTPRRIKTQEEWDRLTQSTNTTSNIPEAVYISGRTFSFYPSVSSATTNACYVNFKSVHKDLSVADYTTGTITTATNGSTSIVGSTTVWTAQMAGQVIKITGTNTANTGDNFWYRIASVESTTALTLETPYAGNSIAAGSVAYTIGETSIIPEDFQMLPIQRTLEYYFTFIQPEQTRATQAKGLYAEGIKRMNAELGSAAI